MVGVVFLFVIARGVAPWQSQQRNDVAISGSSPAGVPLKDFGVAVVRKAQCIFGSYYHGGNDWHRL